MSWGRVVRRSMFPDLAEGIQFDSEAIETGGFTFSDGRCIELIKDNGGGLRLLDSRHKNAVTSIEVEGRTYIPPTLNASLLEVLTLPTGRASLWLDSLISSKRVCALFVDNGISDEAARLFAYFAISTWFLDVLPIAPCLTIVGPRPEAHLALQLLSSVVHHGIPLADINATGFRALPMYIQLTLLIERLHPSMHRALSASAYPNSYLPLGDSLLDPCCAKAVYAGSSMADGLSGEATLRVNHRTPPCDTAVG